MLAGEILERVSLVCGCILSSVCGISRNVFDPRQMRISIQGTGVYVNRERGHR